jgi:hypothetical protein
MKLHIRDIRLFNNAGISFPVCRANEKLLDMDATRYSFAKVENGHEVGVTCKHCIRIYPKRYPWTRKQP